MTGGCCACWPQVEGLRILVDDIVGATGLELKSDPGVPIVYLGEQCEGMGGSAMFRRDAQPFAWVEGSGMFDTKG